MVTSRILRAAAVAVTSVGLVAGFAGVAGASAGSSSLTNTGPDSTNKIISKNGTHVSVHNSNMLGLNMTSSQDANTGKTQVMHNTTGGSATSGAATNNNSTNVSVDVSNSMPAVSSMSGSGGNGNASITTTGPDSLNVVVQKTSDQVDVTNTNDITLYNTSEQSASSGSAKVSGNTTGGSATSGAATNNNSSSFTLTVSN